MIVRIGTFHQEPEDTRDWVIDALHGVPGVRATYHVRDPESGAVLSISIFDSEDGERAAVEAIRARAGEVGHTGPGPDEIRMYEVVRYVENR